mgnify:CR=1 FL=1
MQTKFRILVIGAGTAGVELLRQLATAEFVELVCVCDLNPDAPGMQLAREYGAPTSTDYLLILRDNRDIDIIIDVSGVEEVEDSLHTFMKYSDNKHTIIMHESIARLMVSLSKGKMVTIKNSK